MITKKVNRYYCEYCKKAGCNKFYMERHEKHCTANPNRKCRMCAYAELEQTKITDEILSIIPDPNIHAGKAEYWDGEEMSDIYEKMLHEAMDKISPMINGCPACMLSVIRLARKKYNREIDFPFNYKNEAESFLEDHKEHPGIY